MFSVKTAFKNRTIGFYIGLAAAVVALVGAVLYIATDASDRTFSAAAFALMLVGAAAEVLVILSNLRFAPLVCAISYIVGFALTVNAALPSISDVWNGVHFIGGNATLGIVFSVTFFISAVAGIVACFMPERGRANTKVPAEEADGPANAD